MALGYEGYVSIQVDSREDVVLGVGGGVPESRQRIESSSGYGGQIKTPVAEMAIGQPRNYDWTVWDGSVDFEVTEDILEHQIIPWIFDRQKGASISISTRSDNVQEFSSVYWNQISLTASESSPVSGSVGFVSVDRDTYTRGGDYIGNKQGAIGMCASPPPYLPESLNSNLNAVPVPYWNSYVEINGTFIPMVSWTIELRQEVSKFFTCENNYSPVAPVRIGVGPMAITFRGDYMFTSADGFVSPDDLTSLYLTIGSQQIKLEDLELQTDEDLLKPPTDMTLVSLEYDAYKLVA